MFPSLRQRCWCRHRRCGKRPRSRPGSSLAKSSATLHKAYGLPALPSVSCCRLAFRRWRAPLRRQFPVAGRSGKATIQGQLVNMRDGGFISQHDFHIASLIAGVVTGGDVDANTMVTEEYLMTLERKAFCSLLTHPKTQERIMGMLSTGKPVRN